MASEIVGDATASPSASRSADEMPDELDEHVLDRNVELAGLDAQRRQPLDRHGEDNILEQAIGRPQL